MKNGALNALITEIRTSEIDFFSPSAVERLIEKAFAAGKQVAYGEARFEVIEACAGERLELRRKVVDEILKRLEVREQRERL
jgi:hypothetical protein